MIFDKLWGASLHLYVLKNIKLIPNCPYHYFSAKANADRRVSAPSYT